MLLRIDDQLALHAHMAEPAQDATLERIAARRLRDEFNRYYLPLRQPPTILRRRKDQTRRAIGDRTIRIDIDLESVIVIGCSDSQFDPGSLFDVDWGWDELVFLRGHIDDLNALILRQRLLLASKSGGRQNGRKHGEQENASEDLQRSSPLSN